MDSRAYILDPCIQGILTIQENVYVRFFQIGNGLTEKKARKKTTERLPFSAKTVNKVVKEKIVFGEVLDGPSPRTRLSIFDSLSLEMKDKIRFTVSMPMQVIKSIPSTMWKTRILLSLSQL